MASVKVAVRARPLSKRERDLRCPSIIDITDQTCRITNIKLPVGGNDTLGRERIKNFTYDYAYWSGDPQAHNYASQEKIYNDLGVEVVRSAYDGYNACVFAYGQTGSGKTYTMMGCDVDEQSNDDLGLIPRICQNLFNEMKDEQTTYRTEVSYLEIYNERVRDLLREEMNRHRNLKVREHPKDGPYVQDLSKHLVVSAEEVGALIERGNGQRTTAATNMNDASSRSHAIFSLVFTQATFRDDIPSELHSKVNLVDLAGSERADAAGTTGERLKEGGSINKSLVTLGNVISTLADLADKFRPGPKTNVFVPYRDSVLTWLLKDSLGGNARTFMIATVSPAECNYAETLSTLRYANRAKRIVNKPTVNEDPNVRLIRELREENGRLKELLLAGTSSVTAAAATDLTSAVETRERLNQNEERMRQLTEKWADKWQETANILEEHESLALRREGTGVVLDSELPYLLAIDDNVLSTGMRLYHIKEGDTLVGRDDAGCRQDIVLVGAYIEAEHCVIRHEPGTGTVHLVPREGARCSINNVRAHQPTRLSQGALIRLGKSHIFRFNHPGEAAKLREQAKINGETQLVQVQKDFQWTWSTLSMNDSAFGGSDFDIESERGVVLVDDVDRLEERRREIEAAEQEHVLAEARRLSLLAQQEAQKEQLRKQEEEAVRIARQAQRMRREAQKAEKEITRLSEQFASRLDVHIAQEEIQKAEQQRLAEEKSRVEAEKARIREKRARIRAERERARAEGEVERRRTEAEWEELRLQKLRVESRTDKVCQQILKEKEQAERHRELEREIFAEGMASVRAMVAQEVADMRRMVSSPTSPTSPTSNPSEPPEIRELEAGLGAGGVLEPEEGAGDSLATITEEDDEDLFDINALRLTLMDGDGAGGGAIPLQYLLGSPVSETQPMCGLDLAEKPVEEWTGEEVSAHVAALWEQVADVRANTCRTLVAKYESILSADDRTATLGDSVMESFTNIRPLFDQMHQLTQYHSDDQQLVARLQEYDRALSTVDLFIQIHSVIRASEAALGKRAFLRALEHLGTLQGLMGRLEGIVDPEQEQERQVQKLFATELCIVREKLLYGLGEAWDAALRWSLPSEARLRRDAYQPRTVTLEVTVAAARKEEVTSTVQAMYDAGMLDSRLQTLCQRLVSYFIEPVVAHRNTLLQVIEETEKYICVVLNPTPVSAKIHVPPVEVFMKLEQIFLFLHKPLHNIIVHEKDKDGKLFAVTLVEKIGSMICKKLFECIYNQCLCHVLPQSSGQFDEFNKVVTLTENFQDLLTRLHFLSTEYSTLMDYLNNVNNLFANIKSQEMLRKAQEFLTQELMTSVEISAEHPLGFPARGGELHPQEKFVKECKEAAGTANYRLPTCQISVPIRSLMSLAYSTLEDAVSPGTGRDGTIHLAESVHSMFQLYCDVVPQYHKEKLTNLPLLAALHHNNCMFVAHHLLTVDRTFRRQVSGASGASGGVAGASGAGAIPGMASDLVPRVRRLGNDAFTQHINSKKQRLTEYLDDTHGFECIADDEGSGAQAAVRHMLNHLTHISNIWKDILPTNAYFRAVGSLLNAAIEDIIKSVLSIEEFSAEDCDYLQDTLSRILEAAEGYFERDDPPSSPSTPTPTRSSSTPRDTAANGAIPRANSTPRFPGHSTLAPPPSSSSSSSAPLSVRRTASAIETLSDSSPKPKSAQVTLHESVPSWLKFRELVRVLGSGLAEVGERWADGKGPLGLVFTPEELRRLVLAIFENTSKRDALLRQLRRPSVSVPPPDKCVFTSL